MVFTLLQFDFQLDDIIFTKHVTLSFNFFITTYLVFPHKHGKKFRRFAENIAAQETVLVLHEGVCYILYFRLSMCFGTDKVQSFLCLGIISDRLPSLFRIRF